MTDVKWKVGIAKTFAKLTKAVEQGGYDGIGAVVQFQAQDTVSDMAKGKSGVKYSALRVRSSAPGQSPAIQSGDVARGIKAEGDRPKIEWKLISEDDKSAWLEFGTLNMAPRPFMMPASRKMRKALPPAVEKSVAKEINKAFAS